MKLKILCDAAGILCPAEHWEDEIDSIVTDSRAASAGSLFVCLCGTQTDGAKQLDKQALACVCALLEGRAPDIYRSETFFE